MTKKLRPHEKAAITRRENAFARQCIANALMQARIQIRKQPKGELYGPKDRETIEAIIRAVRWVNASEERAKRKAKGRAGGRR
jgi:hypothetical protein